MFLIFQGLSDETKIFMSFALWQKDVELQI